MPIAEAPEAAGMERSFGSAGAAGIASSAMRLLGADGPSVRRQRALTWGVIATANAG